MARREREIRRRNLKVDRKYPEKNYYTLNPLYHFLYETRLSLHTGGAYIKKKNFTFLPANIDFTGHVANLWKILETSGL
jgi:hypothetical protein